MEKPTQEILPIEGKTSKGSVSFLVAVFLVAFLVMILISTSTSKVYIMMRQYSFTPQVIRLRFGGLYDLIFFSPDVFHGVSLIQDGSLNAVVMPNMTSKLLSE